MLINSEATIDFKEKPRGVVAAALLFLLLAAYLLTCALLVQFGIVSFTTAASLLGGMETMGPLIYVGAAAVAAAIGIGLIRMQGWARHLASVATGVVFVLAIPTISGAVAYSRISAIAREGAKIIVCVIIFRYLNTGEVSRHFDK
jgi:hypothetical protein